MLDLLPMLSLGLGLGLVHALDADHVMAISALNSEQGRSQKGLFFSSYWALGHGVMIALVAILLFAFGWVIPAQFTHIAEMAVGLLLVVLGVSLLFSFKAKQIQLDQHSHGNVTHSHWHSRQHLQSQKNDARALTKTHKPVLVGLLHGFAGSAPAIALIPALAYGEFSLIALYLLTFSMGVMLAMICFSVGFCYCQDMLNRRYALMAKYQAKIIGLTSMTVGGFWLSQAV